MPRHFLHQASAPGVAAVAMLSIPFPGQGRDRPGDDGGNRRGGDPHRPDLNAEPAGHAAEDRRVRDALDDARRRTVRRIEGLERSVAAIIEAAEFTATDDEHDPEGATIAYERAQAISLLRQARADLEMLDAAGARLDAGATTTCAVCGRPIAVERLLALPGTATCVTCAR